MPVRRGPKQSPFIGKRVPLVDKGVHILYRRYVDPAEIVQGGGHPNKQDAQTEALVDGPPAKRHKKTKASPETFLSSIHDEHTEGAEVNRHVEDATNSKASGKQDKKEKKQLESDTEADVLRVQDSVDDGRGNIGDKQGGGTQSKGTSLATTGPEAHAEGLLGVQQRKVAKKWQAGAEVLTANAEQGDDEGQGQHGTPSDRKKGKKEKKKQTVPEDREGGGKGEGAVGQQVNSQEEVKKKRKDKKKDKNKKQSFQQDADTAGTAEKKLTSGGSNADEAGLIRNLLGYRGSTAPPVPGFCFQFAVTEVTTQAKETSSDPAPAAPLATTQSTTSQAAQDDGYVPRRVYVGGMPYHWDEDDIREYWSYCGEVEGLDLMRFPDSGKFRGIAFLTFKTQGGYEAALQYNGEQLDGCTIKVDKCKAAAMRKGQYRSTAGGSNPGQSYVTFGLQLNSTEQQPGRARSNGPTQHTSGPTKTPGYNVAYVGNIAFEATLDDVVTLFKPYQGFVRLHTDKDSKEHKGYAHVQFPDEAALDRALELDGYKLMSRKIRVSYGQPKKTAQ